MGSRPGRSSTLGPCVGDEWGRRRARHASVLVSGSPCCVQWSSCGAFGGRASFLTPTLLPTSKGEAWEMQQGCPACLHPSPLLLPASDGEHQLPAESCLPHCTYQEAFACSWLLDAISTSAGESPSASSAHWVLLPCLLPRTSCCDLQLLSSALR